MNSVHRSLFTCFICLCNVTASADDAQSEFTPDQIEFFEKQIRPILVEHCQECHGADEPEAGLRLTSRQAILRGGDSGPAIVPGMIDKGELLLAVSYDADGYQMPPDGKLPQETINLLRDWVAMGAPWPAEADVADATDEFDLEARAERYSFQPLQQVQPPEVQHTAWPRTPIDCFLLERLEAAGLAPAPPTDKRTWIRRAYFDTLGLPPTPQQVQAFLDDDSPLAFDRVVDGLLASPHFGERWGRHWLDLVRYAESRGHEFDYDVPNAWHYRDYVVRALNDDVPYDQFVVEHVAGDLLGTDLHQPRQVALYPFIDGADINPGLTPTETSGTTFLLADGAARTIDALDAPRWSGLVDGTTQTLQIAERVQRRFDVRFRPGTGANESILGTGFWFLGEWVHSPVDIRQEEADRFDNMIDVYSKTFLGLTVACARCHDHKFDPITQADFYALQGYLQSSSYRQARFESMDHNRRIADRIDELRSDATPLLLRTLSDLVEPTIGDLGRYIAAARDAMQTGPQFNDRRSEITFEDFENGTYDEWEVTGDAFGDGPQSQETIAPYQGDVRPEGRFFVNSHQKRDGGAGDRHIGTLTSREFTIERNHLRFLVGGGSHEGKTCINLLIDGQPVLSATGRNSNEMSAIDWDVSEYREKTARIQVVDEERGGWGNIGVDHFVFSDSLAGDPVTVTSADFAPAFLQGIHQRAQALGLNGDRLAYWTAHLLNAKQNPDDPFHVFAQDHPAEFVRNEFEQGRARTQQALRDLGEDIREHGQQQIEILFSPGEELNVWSPRPAPVASDGRHFGSGRRRPGSVVLADDPRQPIAAIVTLPAIGRDSLWDELTAGAGTMDDPGRISGWNRAGRTLRTRAFEITSGKLYCLIRGGCNTYVAVDSHILINGPLHGQLIKQHPAPDAVDDADSWRWIEHDVARYQGHRAHLEIVLRGDEPLEIAWIAQADRSPATMLGNDHGFSDVWWRPLRHVEGELQDEQVLLAAKTAFADAVAVCRGQELHRILPIEYHYQLANWLIQNPQLTGLDSEASRETLRQVAEPIFAHTRELESEIQPVSATAPCMMDVSGEDEYVFIRGAWKKPGDTVPRRFLEVFNGTGVPKPFSIDGQRPDGSGRLRLARQMVDPAQTPILPRVIVNRIWQHYFGRGIVPTPDDFGHMGQEPSHPQLLDWLANDLISHDWSLKHIHRQLLLSAAYRMESSVGEPGTLNQPGENDPDNALLHRMNVKRLEGEIIRDAVLSVSGRIDGELYGRSVPVHLTPFMEGRGRPGQSGPVDGHGRRSLYVAVRRNFAEPFFQAFDFPNPHTTTGRRSVSNVPAQALALMNNPLIVQQTRVWAERLLAATEGVAAEERVARLYETAFSRPPTEDELTAGTAFVEAQAAEYGTGTNDVRVWSDYCHVLVNVKEFVFIR